MPTTTCAHSTGNGSTLGPLTKRRGVGAGPVLRPEDLVLPKSENSAVSDAAGLLWPKNARKVGKSENRKIDALKRETKLELYVCVVATELHAFHVFLRGSVL